MFKVIIRQIPETPSTPPTLVFRENPPERPEPPNCQVFTIPGTLLPPPPRKLVVERLPELPAKPVKSVKTRSIARDSERSTESASKKFSC